MASAFGHAFTAIALGSGFPRIIKSWKFWSLGIVCSVLPDADVVAFAFGIPYDHLFGHRGFSHSILFAVILSILFTILFYRTHLCRKTGLLLMLYFFLSTISHSLLDALTNGGLGVAFFAPFDNGRYFFPWRPIQVSPIGVDNFFTEWGKRVLLSEAVWIGIPCLIYITIVRLMKSKTYSPMTDQPRSER